MRVGAPPVVGQTSGQNTQTVNKRHTDVVVEDRVVVNDREEYNPRRTRSTEKKTDTASRPLNSGNGHKDTNDSGGSTDSGSRKLRFKSRSYVEVAKRCLTEKGHSLKQTVTRIKI